MNRLRIIVLVSIAISLALARFAAADVPNSSPGCAEDSGHCTECVRHGYHVAHEDPLRPLRLVPALA